MGLEARTTSVKMELIFCTFDALCHASVAQSKSAVQGSVCQCLLSQVQYLETPCTARVAAHVRGEPASAPRPVTTLNTPGGRPTSSMMAASSRHVTDVISDGFSTTVQPCKVILYEHSGDDSIRQTGIHSVLSCALRHNQGTLHAQCSGLTAAKAGATFHCIGTYQP